MEGGGGEVEEGGRATDEGREEGVGSPSRGEAWGHGEAKDWGQQGWMEGWVGAHNTAPPRRGSRLARQPARSPARGQPGILPARVSTAVLTAGERPTSRAGPGWTGPGWAEAERACQQPASGSDEAAVGGGARVAARKRR